MSDPGIGARSGPGSDVDRTDRETMERLAGGDLGALERLYDQYGAMSFSVAYRITGESAVVKDLPPGAAVVMRLAAQASLRVRARGGEASGSFTMVVVSDGEKTINFVVEAQAGAPIQIDGLPAGTWRVLAHRGNFRASTRAAFEPGKTTELDLQLSEPADDE